MITAFVITSNNKKFRFVAKCTNKYVKGATPEYKYTCGNRSITADDYQRNLNAFKQSRN